MPNSDIGVTKKRKRVLLAMSGGTDSSVAAMMLLEQGYEVEGVTFRFFDNGDTTYIADAERVAAELGIRHSCVDHRKEFEQTIIGYFITEYINGRTPMPCALCNPKVKFALLLRLAVEGGFDHIATGHYVQTAEIDGLHYILRGADSDKDQSFFLWGLPQEVLKRLLFPLGGRLKTEVRDYATRKGFTKVATKKDSLGICFCKGDYRDFLRTRLAPSDFTPGEFVTPQGEPLGRHLGVPFYTVGQRRGLGLVPLTPLYVKEILVAQNRIVLASHHETFVSQFTLHSVVFHSEEEFLGSELICRIRYRKQQTPCRVTPSDDGQWRVLLREPLDAVAKGQTAVFYIGQRVVGGGFILEPCE